MVRYAKTTQTVSAAQAKKRAGQPRRCPALAWCTTLTGRRHNPLNQCCSTDCTATINGCTTPGTTPKIREAATVTARESVTPAGAEACCCGPTTSGSSKHIFQTTCK